MEPNNSLRQSGQFITYKEIEKKPEDNSDSEISSKSGISRTISNITDNEKEEMEGFPVDGKVLRLDFRALREGSPSNEKKSPSSKLRKLSSLGSWRKLKEQLKKDEIKAESPRSPLSSERGIRRKKSDRQLTKMPSIPKKILQDGSRFMQAYRSTLESNRPDLKPLTKQILKEGIWNNIREEHIPKLLAKLGSRNKNSVNEVVKMQSPRIKLIFEMIQNDQGEFKFKADLLNYFDTMISHFDSFPYKNPKTKKWVNTFVRQTSEIKKMQKATLENVLKTIYVVMSRLRNAEKDLIFMAFGGASQFEELDHFTAQNLFERIKTMTKKAKELAEEQSYVVSRSYYSLPNQKVLLPNEKKLCKKYTDEIRRHFFPQKQGYFEEIVINNQTIPIPLTIFNSERDYFKFIISEFYKHGWEFDSIQDDEKISKISEEETENLMNGRLSPISRLLRACTINDELMSRELFETLNPSINQFKPLDTNATKETKKSGSWSLRGSNKSHKAKRLSQSDRSLTQQLFESEFDDEGHEYLDCREYRYTDQKKQLILNIEKGKSFEIIKYPAVKLCPLPEGQKSHRVGKLHAILKRKSICKGKILVEEGDNGQPQIYSQETKSDQILQIEFSEHTNFKKRREVITRMKNDRDFRTTNEKLLVLKTNSSHEVMTLVSRYPEAYEPQEASDPQSKEKKGVAAGIRHRLKRKKSRE